MQAIMFMKNFAIAGGLLSLALQGAGELDVDPWLTGRDTRTKREQERRI